MPVIGRLDKQVEDVLISPLSKKRPPAPEQTRDEDEPSQTPDAEEPARDERRGSRPETLPVWLL